MGKGLSEEQGQQKPRCKERREETERTAVYTEDLVIDDDA